MSARTDDNSKVALLDAGADDYITKPFSVEELQARLRVAARHIELSGTEEPVFEAGPLKLDYSYRKVWLEGSPVHLTPLEYKLLSLLAKNCGKVITHRQLLSEVWGAEYSEDAQYLRVYMGYLRKKLEPRPDSPKIILTEHRVGYRLAV
jgi:two-component system KDP operon response regulator KdpE